MSDQREWQLEGSAPELYDRYLVAAVTSLWAADLVERAALHRGERVLDVACGTGVVARAADAAVGAGGTVVGLDLNAGMLSVARSHSRRRGDSIEWREGSALALPFGTGSFDVVLCQLGLQFFPDRPLALAEMRRVLVAGGRLGLNVYGAIEHNPATHALADSLDALVTADVSLAKRTEHALADVRALSDLVAAAGFGEIDVATVTKTITFPSPAEYVRIQLAATPLAAAIAATNREALVAALTERVGERLAGFVSSNGLSFPQEAHVLQARA